MQELHVETASGLEDLCKLIRGSEWLALDTEFVREKSYYPRFGLLQICNGEVAASVDPLAIDDLTPLLEILYDTGIVKVFHAARQDLEIFHYHWDRLPQPLFDTQLAASLLGLGDQVGYGALVHALLGRELEKGHTRTDWTRRPLDRDQLRYALDDVIYLGEIYSILHSRLQQTGRGEWLNGDFEQLADPATYIIDATKTWKRVKGHQHLKGVQLAVLQSVAAWRETEAMEKDRPRRWILKDDPLLEMARRQPETLQQLERIRGMESGTIKRCGESLLQRIAAGRGLPKEQWPREKARPARLNPNQEARTDLLMCSLRLVAEQEGITPSAIASRKDLERLVAGERELEVLRGWRGRLFGDILLAVLDGEQLPLMKDGRLILAKS
jgi:ribonuclease D